MKPTDEELVRWGRTGEEWLVFTVGDLVTPEGADRCVRYQYVPMSARIERWEEEEPNDRLRGHVLLSYRILSSELGDPGRLPRPVSLTGALDVPVRPSGELDFSELDPLEGIALLSSGEI